MTVHTLPLSIIRADIAHARAWLQPNGRREPHLRPDSEKTPRRASYSHASKMGRPTASPGNAKRPLRAERPVLPRPGAAVLSARRGLTAEFGMGSGDPPLCGSARGRRSRGQLYVARPGPGSTRRPGGRMRAPCRHDRETYVSLSVSKRRARAISNARLRCSHTLQLHPIDLIVYKGPYQKGNSSWGRLPA